MAHRCRNCVSLEQQRIEPNWFVCTIPLFFLGVMTNIHAKLLCLLPFMFTNICSSSSSYPSVFFCCCCYSFILYEHNITIATNHSSRKFYISKVLTQRKTWKIRYNKKVLSYLIRCMVIHTNGNNGDLQKLKGKEEVWREMGEDEIFLR